MNDMNKEIEFAPKTVAKDPPDRPFVAGDMVPFAQLFPGIVLDEIWQVENKDYDSIPRGKLYFLESYCADPKCDCKRVFLNVRHAGRILATIGFGWGTENYYRKWYAGKTEKTTDAFTEEIIHDLRGPVLETTGCSSEYSGSLLEYFKSTLENDAAFVCHIRRHYALFKYKLKKMKRA